MTREFPDDRVPRWENLGSAGDPHGTERGRHIHSTNFEQIDVEDAASPAHCEVCGASIHPTRSRCSDHRQKRSEPADRWSISNVALGVVPASTRLAAVSIAAAAFRHRDRAPTSDSFDLIYDFTDDASEVLTDGWGGELPEAVLVESSTGQTLLEYARAKIDASIDGTGGDPAAWPTNPYVMTTPNTAVTNVDELGELVADAEDRGDDLWIVPALLYTYDLPKQKSSTEEPVIDHDRDYERKRFEKVMQRLEDEGKLEEFHE